jgi:non-specific protein-tyrosine kinase
MNDFMELRKVITGLLKWWWVLILLTGIMGVAGYMVSREMTRVYQATTTLMVGQSIQSTDLTRTDIQTSESLAQTYANLARRHPVLQGTIDALELNTTNEALRDRVRVELVEGTQLLEIKVNATSPAEAEAIANEIAHQLILISPTTLLSEERDENQRFVRQRLESLQTKIEAGQIRLEELDAAMTGSLSAERVQELQAEINNLEQLVADWENNFTQLLVFVESERSPNYLVLMESAQAGSDPIRPRTSLNTLLAGVLGLIMGIGLALLLDYLDDTLKSTDDLSQSLGLTALGAIGRINGRQYPDMLITSQNLFSATAEAYRMVRSNIQFMSVDQPTKSIVVTSSGPGEGKSTTVANLGIVMAQAGLKTVIVDADLRRPTQHEIFQVPNLGGLTDLLCSSGSEVQSYLRQTNVDNLSVMISGVLPPNPAELLSSQRMKQLIAQLSEVADVVIYDSPPVLLVTDATVLSNRVDGTILVTKAGKTRHGVVRQAVSVLRQAGAHLLGSVINQIAEKRNDSYHTYYSSKTFARQKPAQQFPQKESKSWRERVPFFR